MRIQDLRRKRKTKERAKFLLKTFVPQLPALPFPFYTSMCTLEKGWWHQVHGSAIRLQKCHASSTSVFMLACDICVCVCVYISNISIDYMLCVCSLIRTWTCETERKIPAICISSYRVQRCSASLGFLSARKPNETPSPRERNRDRLSFSLSKFTCRREIQEKKEGTREESGEDYRVNVLFPSVAVLSGFIRGPRNLSEISASHWERFGTWGSFERNSWRLYGGRAVEKEMGSRLVRVRRIRILLPIATGEFETRIGPRTSS
jgi:hypothetical protein